MKTLLTILIIFLSLSSCKKKKTEPDLPPVPVECNQLPNYFYNSYFTYNTSYIDTIHISVIDNSCESEIKYKLVNLAGIMASWGVAIQDRDYYVYKSKMEIQDTLKLEIKEEAITHNEYIRISVKYNGSFTPYLELPELKK